MAVTAKLFLPILMVTACCADDINPAAKPACNAQNENKLWPEKTSKGTGVPIEICVTKYWGYRWEQLTVDVSQLKGKHKAAGTATTGPVTRASNAATPPE